MSSNELIAGLTQSLKPVKHLSYARICAEWISITFASFMAIALLYNFRSDLAIQFASPLFAAEILLNILLIAVAGLTATALAYPGRAKAALHGGMLVFVFAGYSLITLITAFRNPGVLNSMVITTPHGLECLLCILSFAAIPALWMLWRLRALAITMPMQAGLAALMMATATGGLGVRLVEAEVVPDGLMLWHYLPLLVFSGIGLFAGAKIFRW